MTQGNKGDDKCGRGRRFVCHPKRLYRVWCPHSHTINGYRPSFLGEKSYRVMQLAINLDLKLSLRMTESIPPLPHTSS